MGIENKDVGEKQHPGGGEGVGGEKKKNRIAKCPSRQASQLTTKIRGREDV